MFKWRAFFASLIALASAACSPTRNTLKEIPGVLWDILEIYQSERRSQRRTWKVGGL